MAFCPNCGAEVQGRFCAKCGSPVAAAAEPGGGAQASGAIPPPPAAQTAQAGMADNMAAALCYLLGVLTGILFLVLEPYSRNKTIRFHAFQSIFVWVGALAAWIAVTIISIILSPIPFAGFMISVVLHFGLGLGLFILWLMLMYKAYNNERWVLPVVGPLAEKQA